MRDNYVKIDSQDIVDFLDSKYHDGIATKGEENLYEELGWRGINVLNEARYAKTVNSLKQQWRRS